MAKFTSFGAAASGTQAEGDEYDSFTSSELSDAVPVSGLIISFSPDSRPPDATLEQLRCHPFIQVGEASDHRLPIVVDTANSEENSTMWEWLNSLPGVIFVDLVYLHFEDGEHLPASMDHDLKIDSVP